MARRQIFFITCFLLFLFPFNTLAQRGGYNAASVTGTIYSEDGHHRLGNVMVNLCDETGNLIQQSASMDAGEFAFRGLKRSEYTLKFSLDGYEPAQVKVDLGFGSVRGTTVYLKRVRSSIDTPGEFSQRIES